ncbi:MAG: hypothetical protein COA54_01510 [Thiotrichaceae bacterium]|nr:MAG: hypothetical protein COA54_01510 [Thiotrichaceae bacterium]
MSLYSLDKLINETRRLAAEFKRTTGTMLPVSGEIARYDVSTHLKLTLNDDPNCGHDAIGLLERAGIKYLIKSRVVGDTVKSGHRIGQLNLNGNWDIIVLSLMNNDFEPMEMYQLKRADVIDVLANANKKRGKRGAISIAKFKIIGDLIWTRENGTEDTKPHTISKEARY